MDGGSVISVWTHLHSLASRFLFSAASQLLYGVPALMPKRSLHETLSREFSLTQREKTETLLESAAKRSSLEGFFSDEESKDSLPDGVLESKKDSASELCAEPAGYLKNTSNSTYKFGKISSIEEPLSTCFITRGVLQSI